MARLWELAALALLLITSGVVLTLDGIAPEVRYGALVAIAGAALVVGRLPRRPPG